MSASIPPMQDVTDYSNKEVLTTGQVARICNVAPRTAAKWFDTGLVSGYRLPMSNSRRIYIHSLVQMLKQHNIPIPNAIKSFDDHSEQTTSS